MSVDMENRQLFTVAHCIDHQNEHAQEQRIKFMKGHLAHVEAIMDKIIVAGPMFAEDGKTIVGSMFIYKTNDKEQALSYLKSDPYYKADIWKTVSVNIFRGAIGDVVGGKAY